LVQIFTGPDTNKTGLKKGPWFNKGRRKSRTVGVETTGGLEDDGRCSVDGLRRF
jgi:hypothetical protein